MNFEFCQGGNMVFDYEDSGDKFYMIIEGEVAFYIPQAPTDNKECEKHVKEKLNEKIGVLIPKLIQKQTKFMNQKKISDITPETQLQPQTAQLEIPE